MKYKAFTLVELLVVITILWILSTVAFVSYMGYSENSRDSARISNLTKLEKSLEARKAKAWEYPTPDESSDVKYLGKTIFTQWTLGTRTKKHLKFQAEWMDPKYEADYTYSVTANGDRFEIWTIMEDGTNNTLGLFSNTYASEDDVALNHGNFNWKFYSTKVNGETHVFTIPSLILKNKSWFEVITNNPTSNFAITGAWGLPETYTGKSKANQTVNFTPRLLYKGPNCGVETDQEIVNFVATLRDSFNIEPFISDSTYNSVFEDFEYLRNNIDDFEALEEIWIKINESLGCHIKNFKTEDIFPTQCGYETWDFEWLKDANWFIVGPLENGFDIETQSCLFNYKGTGTAIVQAWIGENNTQWLYIDPVSGTWSFEYRVFTHKPFKMSFDYKTLMTNGGYLRFYINDVEYLYKNTDVSTFTNFETPLLKPGLYDFKWDIKRYASTGVHKWQVTLDNIDFSCIWWWINCGREEGSLELWLTNPWDIFEFSWDILTPWSHVTGVGNTSWADNSYAIKSPTISNWKLEAILKYKKNINSPKKLNFDFKTDLNYSSNLRFFINNIEYYYEDWYWNWNIPTNYSTFTTPLLPEWNYEFKWVLYRAGWDTDVNLWLDNILFTCSEWAVGCWLTENGLLEPWIKNPWEIMIFWGESNLPWPEVTWTENVSTWSTYAIKSPKIDPYTPYPNKDNHITITKVFTQPQKFNFDIKTKLPIFSEVKFYINWIEYFFEKGSSWYHGSDYKTITTPILPIGTYDFKWMISRKWSSADTFMWLDNMKSTCIWWGVWCGWTNDGMFEQWDYLPWDTWMYTFTWGISTPWMQVTGIWQTTQGDYAIKSWGLSENFSSTSMKFTKTVTEWQKISFDMKTHLQSYLAYTKFKINWDTKLYLLANTTWNVETWYNNYESLTLSAGTYEFEWEVYKHNTSYIWLDNIIFNN